MVLFEHDLRRPGRSFRTAVSLHGHTLHSRESLGFIYKFARSFPPLRAALTRGERRYREVHGTALDLNRAWWTPPLAPHDAWLLEQRHIEESLCCRALVSLTDHDNIDAPLALRVLDECHTVPVSVEWTVPFSETFLHLGVHNLDTATARSTMQDFESFTAAPDGTRLAEILAAIHSRPDALVVVNHPCWDEAGIGRAHHRAALRSLVERCGPWLHAFEINGLRPWAENRAVLEFAGACGKPVVSGGDRHALEPNTVLNLTNASSFSEFAAEVRSGRSDVCITPRYLESFTMRVLHDLEQILAEHDNHGRGWRLWSDRVFHQCDDGVVRSLTTLFGGRPPVAVRFFVAAVQALRAPALRGAFRTVLGGRQETAG
jgi:hypothetical protein